MPQSPGNEVISRRLLRPAVLVPLGLIVVHLVLLLAFVRRLMEHPDGSASMGWILFALLDYGGYLAFGGEPQIVHAGGAPVYHWLQAAWFGLVGSVQWGLLGAAVGWAIERRSSAANRPVLGTWCLLGSAGAVLAALGAAIAWPFAQEAIAQDRKASTIYGLDFVKKELALYAAENDGAAPPSLPFLFVEVRGWDNPHLWQDAWGRELHYEPATVAHGQSYVTSYGRDGVLGGTGTEKDITR